MREKRVHSFFFFLSCYNNVTAKLVSESAAAPCFLCIDLFWHLTPLRPAGFLVLKEKLLIFSHGLVLTPLLPPLSVLLLPFGLLQQNTANFSAQLGTMMPLAGAEALLCRRPGCTLGLGLDWLRRDLLGATAQHQTRPLGIFPRFLISRSGGLMKEQYGLELQGLLRTQTRELDEKHVHGRVASRAG